MKIDKEKGCGNQYWWRHPITNKKLALCICVEKSLCPSCSSVETTDKTTDKQTDFILSEYLYIEEPRVYHEIHVKQFIRLLKEEFKLYRTNMAGELFLTQRDKFFLLAIDKLAGEFK